MIYLFFKLETARYFAAPKLKSKSTVATDLKPSTSPKFIPLFDPI